MRQWGVNYFKSEGPAHEVVRDIEAAGGTAVAIKADVGDYGEVEAMVNETVSKFGKLDIMVANAGTKGHGKALIELSHDEFAYTIRNHLMGAFNCSRASLPHLRNGVRGDLILISSRSTDMLMAKDSDYNAAKAAIDALAKGVAKEERYHGVRGERGQSWARAYGHGLGRHLPDHGNGHVRGSGQGNAAGEDGQSGGYRESVRLPGIGGGESHIGRGYIRFGQRSGRSFRPTIYQARRLSEGECHHPFAVFVLSFRVRSYRARNPGRGAPSTPDSSPWEKASE